MGAEVGDEIVLVNPSEVIEFKRKVPYGKLTTIVDICKSISKRYEVKGCCSLTTGIFIMTAAKAAQDAKKSERGFGHSLLEDIKSRWFFANAGQVGWR
jgi:hypothetical protein